MGKKRKNKIEKYEMKLMKAVKSKGERSGHEDGAGAVRRTLQHSVETRRREGGLGVSRGTSSFHGMEERGVPKQMKISIMPRKQSCWMNGENRVNVGLERR